MTELYVLRASDAPWGDYGQILRHGLATGTEVGVALQRTGPFVPPIFFPAPAIVVTEATKRLLEPRGFSGFVFREARKERIVRLHWEHWNPNASEPEMYPSNGEPESYVLSAPHDTVIAEQMGALWELVVRLSPGLQIEGSRAIDEAKYRGADLCQGSEWGCKYVSPRLKSWLEEHVAEWVTFEVCSAVGAA
jgi:hypothetical protein